MFEITAQSTKTRARTGIIHTAHGDIETPIFMPVGTQATVKSLDPHDLNNIGTQIILANTYHLHLRPGEDLIAEFGGLHQFMGWDKPILTDSGGFQVFSLSTLSSRVRQQADEGSLLNNSTKPKHLSTPAPEHNDNGTQGRLVQVDDDGVTFRSHIDGSTHRFTPESAMEIQHKLGADIIMAFDECTADRASYDCARQAMERTHRWAERCLNYHKSMQSNIRKSELSVIRKKQFLFGIIQGSNHRDLREESARFISSLDFDGIAIGGESVGFNMEATKDILDWVIPLIPENKPHYAMGVGFSPSDLFEVVERGVDMFDCVSPTRIARNGALFISPCITPPPFARRIRRLAEKAGRGELERGLNESKNNYRININNSCFSHDHTPVDQTCDCYTCQNFSRAYLHHLFKAEELLVYRLATIHNLHFLLNLMKEIREAIREDRFEELKKEWVK